MNGVCVIETLTRALDAWGVMAALTERRSRAWSSATFSGERVSLVYTLDRTPPDGLAACVDALEFDLRSKLVADTAVVVDDRRLTVELLVLDIA